MGGSGLSAGCRLFLGARNRVALAGLTDFK